MAIKDIHFLRYAGAPPTRQMWDANRRAQAEQGAQALKQAQEFDRKATDARAQEAAVNQRPSSSTQDSYTDQTNATGTASAGQSDTPEASQTSETYPSPQPQPSGSSAEAPERGSGTVISEKA